MSSSAKHSNRFWIAAIISGTTLLPVASFASGAASVDSEKAAAKAATVEQKAAPVAGANKSTATSAAATPAAGDKDKEKVAAKKPVSSTTATDDPHELKELTNWADVQKLFIAPKDANGKTLPIEIKLQQDPDNYEYGSAWIAGMIFKNFTDCGKDAKGNARPLPDLDNDLEIEPIDSTIPDSTGKDSATYRHQGFRVAASQALIDCMAYLKANKRYCSDSRPCTSIASLDGGVIDKVEEGNQAALSYCYRNGTETDDLVCKKGKILTPASVQLANFDKGEKAKKVIADNKTAENLENQRTACEKALDGGEIQAFFEANKKIIAEGKFLESHKKGNPDLTKKATDFDEDTLRAENFKKAIAALDSAADSWDAKETLAKDASDKDHTLSNLRKLVHQVATTKLEDDRDSTANRAYAEDVLKVYHKIAGNYLDKALHAADKKTFDKLIAEAEATYKEAKGEKIFNSDQKSRIQAQLDLYLKLKTQMAYAKRDLPGYTGNPVTDTSLLSQFGQMANTGCPQGAVGALGPTPQLMIQAIQGNTDLTQPCIDGAQGYLSAAWAMVQTCQNAQTQAMATGFPSAAAAQCQALSAPGIYGQPSVLTQATAMISQVQALAGGTTLMQPNFGSCFTGQNVPCWGH